MTHGWPGSVVELLDTVGPLTDPTAHGGTPEDAFHLVVPSLPGFGLSTPVEQPGWEVGRTTAAFAELMERLGYRRYGAHGGDIGAGVSGLLGATRPDRVIGTHTTSDARGVALAGVYFPVPEDLSDEDRARLQERQRLWADAKAYLDIQATRPQTLAYALTDSPAGQLAWIVEKFKEWSDPAAELPDDAVDRDQLLTNVSIYWLTATAGSSATTYWERFHDPSMWMPKERSTVPTGVAVFTTDVAIRRFAERSDTIVHWSEFDRGGHFAAMEAPDLLVGDLRAFFRKLR
jgi:pimeloyl-ACP methyl ester carboxylesterase